MEVLSCRKHGGAAKAIATAAFDSFVVVRRAPGTGAESFEEMPDDT
jgi:hypothetical protein